MFIEIQGRERLFVLIGMILLAGTASAQPVKTDYDRSANFAQYKTYSWEHVKTNDSLDIDRIKNAVNPALAAKGWTQVDAGGLWRRLGLATLWWWRFWGGNDHN
jgi:hypothetical protein